MKRANKQIQGRTVSRGADKQRKTLSRRRLLIEGLEQRQLLAAAPFENVAPMGPLPSSWDQVGLQAEGEGAVSPSGGNPILSGNAPTVIAAEPLLVMESEPNNTLPSAQHLILGNQPAQCPSIDVSGSLALNSSGIAADVDWFRFNLKAGDVLNIQSDGIASDLSLMKITATGGAGIEIAGTDRPMGQLLPEASPLLREGTASFAVVIPEDGEYALRVGISSLSPATGTIYTLQMRTFRPGIEYHPVGTSQTLFLDFDGATTDLSELNAGFGTVRIPAFYQAMQALGMEDRDADELIQLIIEEVEENYRDLGFTGNNGNFSLTGTPGEFHINILNSRDHADPWGLPGVSRIVLGGTDILDDGVDVYGQASSIDIGNYELEDSSFVFPEMYAEFEDLVDGLAPSASLVDLYGKAIGMTVSHEAAHFFGAHHTVSTNRVANIVDTGGNDPGRRIGVGPDGIFGTIDDLDTDFVADMTQSGSAIVPYGFFDTVNALAFGLGTGKVGGSVSGTVYQDINRNGTQGSGEPGLAGVTVYADINGNGSFDTGELSAITGATGNYSFAASPGTVRVGVVTPAGYAATTATSKFVSVDLDGSADADFGFSRVIADVTGFKWNDINADGIRDAGEPGIAGVYVYLDLDGDDRIDLGEPRAITKADGSYSINFPGPGTYTIREVVEPGMLQTYPIGGEHVVVFNGTLLSDNYNFGNQSVQDFGDAPSPYPTLAADNGAVHGIVAGFGLGALTDAEPDGQPSPGAIGDDVNGQNDDDGVIQRSPLSPGSANNVIDVSVRNTAGTTSYLQGWIDLNQDGDWNDAGEHILQDLQFVGSATRTLQFSLPASAAIGDTYVRFRLSQTPGIGPTGFASSGEVEDYRVTLVETPEVANNDFFDIPRGAISVPLDLLANDFDPAFNPLTITSINTSGTRGAVVVAADGRSVFYTPRGDSLGLDSFTYTVTNETGTVSDTATVNLNVTFQSAEPIAVDDSYTLSTRASNQILPVSANDIPSIVGGNRIISTSAPDGGGQVIISSDGQNLIYSPALNFSGTEQFTYTISDQNSALSTAKVTIHLPGSQADDVAAFHVQTFAADGVTQIQTVQAGQLFKVRVSVEDLRNVSALQQGLDAAYMDLLFTDGLVATVPSTDPSSPFPFEISFGDQFDAVQTGDVDIPGMFNEIGAFQGNPTESFTGPTELFTLTLRAVSPGDATFTTDPADTLLSDTVLHGVDAELVPRQIRFGSSSLRIIPSGAAFTYAVDDSYPDGRDSLGNLITASSTARLNVLANDRSEAPGAIHIANVGVASNGFVSINNNGTPDNPSDDFIAYRPNLNFSGVDHFTYTILSDSGIQSTAEVTVTVGAAASLDDIVEFQFNLLNAAGNPTTQVNVGETFQVQIMVDDLRPATVGAARGVFAAYMDMLYDARLAQPRDVTGNRLGFDVEFGDDFDPNPAVGDALVPGLINEFGTFQTTVQGSTDPLAAEPIELATITFVALAPGNLRLVADPADVSPFQDTLMFDPPNAVPTSQIRYDVANLTIVRNGAGEGESRLQNQVNRWDVNDDGSVSPIDALLVVNRLNRSGGEGEASGMTTSQYYLDVNGDNQISPIDALQVVNRLNRSGSSQYGGEGEATPPITGAEFAAAEESSSFDEAADSYFTDLGQSSTDLTTGSSWTAGTTTTTDLGSPFGESSEDEESSEEETETSPLNSEL